MKRVWDIAAVAGSRVIRQVVMVLVMAIAARMLGKDLIGVWALIYIVIQYGVLLSDSGISTFIVRHREMDSRMSATAFSLASGIAIVIALMVGAIGVPLATLLGYRDFSWHFIAAAMAIVPLTMNGILQAQLRRDLRFNMMLISDVVASAVLIVAAVGMLIGGGQLWSLIVPTIASAVAGFAVCAFVLGIPRFGWNRDDAKEIYRYSLGVLGFSSIYFWARNIDHVLIGRFLGAAPLGIYAFAYRIMMLPLSQINATAHMVALPYLSPHQDDPKKLRESIHGLTVVIGMLTTLPMTWVWLERDFFVLLVLGEGWGEVAPLLAVLVPVSVLQSMANPIGLCFPVTGKTNQMFRIGMINTCLTTIGFVAGVWLGTLHWVVVCYAIANVVIVPISVGTGLLTIDGRFRDWISWCAPFFGCLGLCWMTYQGLPRVASPWVQAAITVLGTTVAALPIYYFAYRTAFPTASIFGRKNAKLSPVRSGGNG